MIKKIILAAWFILLSSISFAQLLTRTTDGKTQVNIDAFIDGDSTADNQLNSFVIQLRAVANIDSIQIESGAKIFGKQALPPPSDSTGQFKKYTISASTSNDEGNIEIRIWKGGISKKIIIKPGNIVKPDLASTMPTSCHCKLDTAVCKCSKDDYDHPFGEDISTYDNKTITYIYDFSPDTPSKRAYYKITKDGNRLSKKEIANFNNESLTPKKNVRFKVVNINKFRYDVSIDDSLINYDSEPSILLSRFFLGTDTALIGNLMTKFSNAINVEDFKGDSTEVDTLKEHKKQLQDDINCFLTKYDWLRSKMLDAFDQCKKFPCCSHVNYFDLISGLRSIKGQAMNLHNELKEDSIDIHQKLSECTGNKDSIIKAKSDSVNKLSVNADVKKVAIDSIEKSLAKKCTALENNAETMDNYLKESVVLDSLINHLPADSDLIKITLFLQNVIAQNQIQSKDYFSLNGNELDITIKIKSRDSSIIIQPLSIIQPIKYYDSTYIKIPIIMKPFVSFSSGSFIATGKTLQNKVYDWQPTTGNNNTVDTTKLTLVESGYTPPVSGFAALANVEWKFNKSLGAGFSAGVGLTVESKPRLAYLGGASIFFGELRQFTITGGFAAMQVNVLANNFQSIVDNQSISNSKLSIPYNKELKTGYFISLTYTLFKTSKNK